MTRSQPTKSGAPAPRDPRLDFSFEIPGHGKKPGWVVTGGWRDEQALLEFATALGEIAADLWLAGKLPLDAGCGAITESKPQIGEDAAQETSPSRSHLNPSDADPAQMFEARLRDAVAALRASTRPLEDVLELDPNDPDLTNHARYALGYIHGAAAARNVTTLALLDEFSLRETDRRRPKTRHRRR